MQFSGVVVLMATLAGVAVSDEYHDLTNFTTQIENLEAGRNELFEFVNNIENLLSNIEQKFFVIEQETNTRINNRKADQESMIDTMQDQAKALQDKLNDAREHAEEAADLARTVANGMPDITASVDDLLADNTAQDTLMNNIDMAANDTGNDERADLANEIAALNTRLQTAITSRTTIQQFFNRSCAYGTLVASVPDSRTISFPTTSITPFTETPAVALSIIGFRSHILDHDSHGYSYDTADTLAFNVTVTGVTLTDFGFQVTEADDDMVDVKNVYLRYMACSGLSA